MFKFLSVSRLLFWFVLQAGSLCVQASPPALAASDLPGREAARLGMMLGATAAQVDRCVALGQLPRATRSAQEEGFELMGQLRRSLQGPDSGKLLLLGWTFAAAQLPEEPDLFTPGSCQAAAAQWQQLLRKPGPPPHPSNPRRP